MNNKTVLYLVGLVCTAALSSLVTREFSQPVVPDEPVFVLGAVTLTDVQRLPDYQAIAQPLAHKAGGYAPLAFGPPQMLEGVAPAPGVFFVERFDSRLALEKFLDAMEQNKVKALRDEVANMHFMMVLPAYRSEKTE